MSDSQIICDMMNLLRIDYTAAAEILADARMRFPTETQLDRVRKEQFASRLPTYNQAMRFA